MKLSPYESLYPNVNRKGAYFKWLALEGRQVKLNQRVTTAVLAKCFVLFCYNCNYNSRRNIGNKVSKVGKQLLCPLVLETIQDSKQ